MAGSISVWCKLLLKSEINNRLSHLLVNTKTYWPITWQQLAEKHAHLNIEPILTFHILMQVSFFSGLEALTVQEEVRTKTSSRRRQYPQTPPVFPPSRHFKDSLAASQGSNNIRFTRLVIKKFYKVFSASFFEEHHRTWGKAAEKTKGYRIPHDQKQRNGMWRGACFTCSHIPLYFPVQIITVMFLVITKASQAMRPFSSYDADQEANISQRHFQAVSYPK